MTALLTMLFSTIGAGGCGAVLKMMGGWVQGLVESRQLATKERMAEHLKDRAADVEFQRIVFGGSNEDSKAAQLTRRLLAVIGMLNFAAITILCTVWPGVAIVTFTPPEARGAVSFLWGLIRIPQSSDLVSTVTTGHLAIMGLTSLSMILGFYFTPGGKK